MFVHQYDQEAYLAGALAALKAFNACRTPQPAPWNDVAPAWAQEATPRAYAYKRGFATSWNWCVGAKPWPDWTRMPHVFQRPAV